MSIFWQRHVVQPPKNAPWPVQRALLPPQVNHGSLFRCGKSTKEPPISHGRRKGGGCKPSGTIFSQARGRAAQVHLHPRARADSVRASSRPLPTPPHIYARARARAHHAAVAIAHPAPPPTHTHIYTALRPHPHRAATTRTRARKSGHGRARGHKRPRQRTRPWCSSACPCRALWDQLMGLCTWLAQTALRQPTRRRERVPGERRVAGQAGQHARSRQPHRRRARAQPPHTRYAHAHMRTAMRTCAKQARGPPPGLRSPPPVASTGLREKQPASSRNSVLARSRSRSRSHHYLAEGSKIPRDGLLPLVLGVCGICFAFEHISRCCAMLPTLAQTAKS